MRSELLRRNVAVVLLVFVLSGALAAQNNTVPAGLSGVEGGGGTNIPFGSSLACRFQCIYDAEELPWTGPRVITGFQLRADNNAPYPQIDAKGYLDVSVLVSTTDKNSSTASATFADNYGVDALWVINHQQIQLPLQPAAAPSPRPANIPFVFTVPWAYGLTPATSTMPAPRNLLIEIVIHSQPSGLYKIDNLSSCTAATTTFGAPGPTCAEVGHAPLTLGGDVSMQAGLPYSWHVANTAPSMPFLLSLNLTTSDGLLGNPGWPLPYPMFDLQNPSLPSPALTLLGYSAPDCYLSVNPVAVLSGQTDSSGIGNVTAPLPPGRQYVGTTFYTQAIALSPTANALHLITSPGFGATVCGPLGVVRIYTFYPTTQTTLPTAGQVQYGVGMIFDVM